MSTLMKPFVKCLQAIHAKGGVSWFHPTKKVHQKSVIVAPLASADAPVRADLLNMTSHNSKYGCNSCEQKTETVPFTAEEIRQREEGKRIRHRRAFLFKEQPAQLRNHQRLIRQARKARREDKVKKGVKGPSVAEEIPLIDLSTFLFAEYMHHTCLGIARQFLNLWVSAQGPWCIRDHVKEIDAIMLKIKPVSIGRLPRAVSEACRWKASEFRSWLLFYSLPVISVFMPRIYVQHWSLYVTAIYLLLKDEISASDIAMAETMIRLFVRDIGNLYRQKDYSYNVHNINHLPLYVKRWGPLRATSAFGFEGFYFILTNCIHGTKNPAREITKNSNLAYGVQILKTKVARYHQTLTSAISRSTDDVVLLNEISSSIILCESDKKFLDENGFLNVKTVLYYRAKIKRETFTSLLHVAEKRRNNYTVQIMMKESSANQVKYGEFKFFLASPLYSMEPYAVVKSLEVNQQNIIFHEQSRVKVSHIIPVLSVSDLFLVKMRDVKICKLIRVTDYVCQHPNPFERNL